MIDKLHRPTPDRRRTSAAELWRLPLKDRNAILEAQATIAALIYRNDSQLTDFDAFGEEISQVDQ